jgi:hypothetical protein
MERTIGRSISACLVQSWEGPPARAKASESPPPSLSPGPSSTTCPVSKSIENAPALRAPHGRAKRHPPRRRLPAVSMASSTPTTAKDFGPTTTPTVCLSRTHSTLGSDPPPTMPNEVQIVRKSRDTRPRLRLSARAWLARLCSSSRTAARTPWSASSCRLRSLDASSGGIIARGSCTVKHDDWPPRRRSTNSHDGNASPDWSTLQHCPVGQRLRAAGRTRGRTGIGGRQSPAHQSSCLPPSEQRSVGIVAESKLLDAAVAMPRRRAELWRDLPGES